MKTTLTRLAFTVLLLVGKLHAATETPAVVHSLKITLLSTQLAEGGTLAEWGFSAWVEADGHNILFDTGAHRDLVLQNARALKIDLSTADQVILSHSHWDHIAGLITLRQSVAAQHPKALATAHVAEGFFYPRGSDKNDAPGESALGIKSAYEQAGGSWEQHKEPFQIQPGVWLLGPIPRQYPERNWSGHDVVQTPAGPVEDTVPEDTSLVFNTEQGLVILTGCGHAGVINTVAYSRQVVRPARIHALIGGFHLFAATDETLHWTAERLAEAGVDNLWAAHCTGIEAGFILRQALHLDRYHAPVGDVGGVFELGKGLSPRALAR